MPQDRQTGGGKGKSKGAKKGDGKGAGKGKKGFEGKRFKCGKSGHMSKDCRSKETNAFEVDEAENFFGRLDASKWRASS